MGETIIMIYVLLNLSNHCLAVDGCACISIHLLELNELVEDSSQGGSYCLALVMATEIGSYRNWYGLCMLDGCKFCFPGIQRLNDAAAGTGTECREREKILRRQETRWAASHTSLGV
jgi:hypothetical protein